MSQSEDRVTGISFEQRPFSKGRFRLAFKGRDDKGKEYVIKMDKSEYTWERSDLKMTQKIYRKARQWALEFNVLAKTNRPIQYIKDGIRTVIRRSTPYRPCVGEKVTVEEYISGHYKKWCNNYGFISSASLSMPAFMHWTWVRSKGKEMIADLQGAYNEKDGYLLTDPVIMSVDQSYGPTDTGLEGMLVFFVKHRCNDICKTLNLPRPTMEDFFGKIPQAELETIIIQCASDSTMYSFDLQMREETKRIVAGVFREVAKTVA